MTVEKRAKYAGRVDPRQTEPLDVATWSDQCHRLAIRNKAVLANSRERRASDGAIRRFHILDPVSVGRQTVLASTFQRSDATRSKIPVRKLIRGMGTVWR